MAKRKASAMDFPVVHPHAAGIDIGSCNNMACIGPDDDQIQEFGVFTEDHHRMAQWFVSNSVTTVALESTGYYWQSLFLILQSYNLEVILVNAKYAKNISGKKTDVQDACWLWKLHTVGLLTNSFQPDSFTEELRTYNRQRKSLIQGSSRYVSKMQKSLILMNLQLSVVLSDITGKSGKAIISAILAGERDGKVLAQLAHPRVKASKEDIAKALTGHWHEHHLFALQQSWDTYLFYQEQIRQCDQKIDELLSAKVVANGQHDLYYESCKKKRRRKKQKQKNDPKFDIGKHVFQLSDGVDLLAIEGIGLNLLLTLTSEVGLDLKSKFPTKKHFTSWLSLAPNRKVSGGKVLSSKSKRNNNPLAHAFRYAANAIGNMKGATPLSAEFARIAYRRGRKTAITAIARKLATIVYCMLTKNEAYKPELALQRQEQGRNRQIQKLQDKITKLKLKPSDLVFA